MFIVALLKINLLMVHFKQVKFVNYTSTKLLDTKLLLEKKKKAK